ncbi:MAG: alpha/beta hydrolase [Candidatus Micrarchaeota archaeon]|nr:alpha/beta hydrolase [Candidatus Micrarchaeota archaeon]
MKNAIILSGSGETPESFWHPYVKAELEKRGYEVWLPLLPGNDEPDINKTLPFVLAGGKFTEETIIIAHSAGCPLALAVLENLGVKIKQAILVAGFCTPLPGDVGGNAALQKSYNWEKIRENCKDFIFINSDNDPWKCDDKQGKAMWEKLGGTLILKSGEGHMGSNKFNQPYKKFSLIIELVEKQLWQP